MRSTRSSADSWSPRSLATAGLLIALGAVLGLVESALLPPLPVPGVRIGIANIAVVMAVALLGSRKALAVSVLRVIVVAMATGSFGGPSMLLAMAGAVCAWCAMSALASRGATFSVVGWSVAGAAAHVGGQLSVASVLTGSAAPLLFTPVSLALALACGLAVGFASRLLLSRLPLTGYVEVVGS